MRTFSSSSFLRFSAAPYSSALTMLPRRYGEGQDGGTRARKEEEGCGEGQEAVARVVVMRGAAAGLDPGRLDPVFDSASGPGRADGVRVDRQGSGEAVGWGDESSTSTG